MAKVEAVLWDIGGVLLSNAWDEGQRRRVVEKLGLDPKDFERRHLSCAAEFETGRLDLDGYLNRTVFYVRRPFSKGAFFRLMREGSRAHPKGLALARRVARRGRCRMAALNNESAELNAYRIDRFGLADIFDAFLSSCYLGARKPEPAMFEKTLGILQLRPRECCFIDDRPENAEAARELGFRSILYEDPAGLETELSRLGLL